MKKHVSTFTFLLNVFVTTICAMSADADFAVNVIADAPLEISYTDGTIQTMTLAEDTFHDPAFFSNWEFASKSITAPKRPGWNFLGWYTLVNNDGDSWGSGTSPALCTVKVGVDYRLSASEAESCKKTAYGQNGCYPGGAVACPKYSKITFDLTYDANGGTGEMEEIKNCDYDWEFTLPKCEFKKTGYSFAGWKTASGASFSDGQKVGGSNFWVEAKWDFDAKLIAQWTTNSYTVSGATTGTGSGTVTGGGTYLYGTQVTLVATANEGSVFTGWTDGESSASRMIMVGAADAIYTANFEKIKTYTIAFIYRDKNGKSVTDERTGIKEGESVEPPARETVNQWPHHSFVQWESFAYQNVTASAYVNAVYESSRYSVTFDANGGAGAMDALLFESYEEEKPLPENKFARIGYTFAGWATDKNAKEAKYENGESVGGLADEGTVVFYAVWNPISYSIEFKGGGATGGSMETMSGVKYDEIVTLPKNGFVKPGCAFQHWTCGTEVFADGASVSNLTTMANATVTLTAIWDSPFFVKFDANGGEGEMDVQRFEMGEAAPLWPNQFARLGYHFGGWMTNGMDVVFANGQRVSEKDFPGTVPGETNVISAVWNLISLSEAMMVEPNLVWTNSGNTAVIWEVQADQNGTWARQASSASSKASRQSYLTAPIGGNGQLTLSLRMTNATTDGTVRFWISQTTTDLDPGGVAILVPADGSWHKFSTNVVIESSSYLHFVNWSGTGNCDISAMTWTPKSAHPEPGPDDAVTISSAAVSGGKFALKFPSKADFDYNLLTNANLLIDSWGVMTNEVGTGGEITFEPQILEGQPQLFYKVETIQKK